MIKKFLFFICLLFGLFANAQILSKEFRTKKITLTKDSIQFDSVNINSQRFKVLDSKNQTIKPINYTIDFQKALLVIDSKQHQSITIQYYVFPDFVTKTYQLYDDKIIVPNTNNIKQLYSLTTNKKKIQKVLFNGLETKGNITRGVTIGNNQNSVVNASLDLNISGNLSKDITLRANIFDTNIPLQENGYSQNITDFDRVFIELKHKDWRVKAGDLDLTNNESYFLQFSKKVSGLEVQATLSDNAKILASGAIVRGRFTSFQFVGREGNQGPYKIIGQNNESFLIIVAGSDALYANGILLKRGENNDYTIDYNTAEIRFNTTYPITNDLRFRLDYQYSDRNYTRFVTYEKASYKGENFSINGYFYNENDAKNQPIQQALTNSQKQILANAGNDTSKMVSESAYKDVYSDSRILYKKTTIGSLETFEYSTNKDDELYNVNFTFIGSNKADYILDKTIAIGNIYKYAGANLGSYNPVVKLIAPSKSQIVVVNSAFNPTKKTSLFGEFAYSNHDSNLFSSIDDSQNKAFASKLRWNQIFIDGKWQFSSKLAYEFLHENFSTEQYFENVEFKRDWNLINPLGNRQQVNARFTLKKKENNYYTYQFNLLEYADNYNGIRHDFKSKTQLKSTQFSTVISLLNSSSSIEENTFLKGKAKIEHSLANKWIGGFINLETNKRKEKDTQLFTKLSQQFKEYETYFGFGDSTKVYTKLGFNYRVNDSIKNNVFTQTNARKTFYINSKIIQNKNTNLAVYANYKTSKNTFKADVKSLNAKVQFSQKLFDNFISLQTIYETSSANIPRQDYVYIKTEAGQGFYTWIDYNNDGIKDFNEFEIAIYKDQAEYLRVALPNLNFIDSQRAKWTQSMVLNLSQWATKKGLKKSLSHYYNQTNFLIDNQQKRNANDFNLNPFNINESDLLGLNFSFRNSLYFNKSLQKYSWIYTYGKSKNKQLYSIGKQENNTILHQIEFLHKLTKFWVFDFKANSSKEHLITENFTNQNYEITGKEISPKFTYKYNKDHHLSFFYRFKNKKNTVLNLERLKQQNLGISYNRVFKKSNLFATEINLFSNDFTGNQNSPVAYQMLEGLQPGKNYTWSIIYQQKINSFLNLNFNYLGRKSKNSPTIHNGSIQLKASF